ncbi:LysR family transcriptional regulator [Enterocloster asparagiformis]|uniref:LysR family transcriptional regulator n=1 Tax=Enterocloster asparagiformis TaxID=333367 RepID=UPI002A7FE25D|nr:LysR family transcriptional regulator [Enterocloster asparagiformis]
MNLNDYYYVSAIEKNQSISKAAKELYISQSYLSRYLSNLEEKYHALFFDRSSYPLRITSAGKCYLKYAYQILNLEKTMESEVEDIVTGNIGTLTVGIATLTSSYIIPYVIPMFTSTFPGIELRLIEENSDVLTSLLTERKIDLAIMNRPVYPKDIICEFILRERIFLAVPPRHEMMRMYHPENSPFCTLQKQEIHLLNDQPFVLASPKQSMGLYERQILEYYDITPRIVLISESIQTAYRLTAQNIGFSFIGETHLMDVHMQNAPGLFQLEDQGWSRTLSVAYSQKDYLPKSTRCFIQCLKKIGQKFHEGYYKGIYGIDIDDF